MYLCINFNTKPDEKNINFKIFNSMKLKPLHYNLEKSYKVADKFCSVKFCFVKSTVYLGIQSNIKSKVSITLFSMSRLFTWTVSQHFSKFGNSLALLEMYNFVYFILLAIHHVSSIDYFEYYLENIIYLWHYSLWFGFDGNMKRKQHIGIQFPCKII